MNVRENGHDRFALVARDQIVQSDPSFVASFGLHLNRQDENLSSGGVVGHRQRKGGAEKSSRSQK